MPEIANTESYRSKRLRDRKEILEVRHLGDITKINGAEIEPVDVITAGSPC